MELGNLFILLLLLACPLMMVWMMRGHGGHSGHASHGAGHGPMHDVADETSGSLDELRRRRDEFDAEITRLEQAETETKAPAGV
jgi:hypothetical protein